MVDYAFKGLNTQKVAESALLLLKARSCLDQIHNCLEAASDKGSLGMPKFRWLETLINETNFEVSQSLSRSLVGFTINPEKRLAASKRVRAPKKANALSRSKITAGANPEKAAPKMSIRSPKAAVAEQKLSV